MTLTDVLMVLAVLIAPFLAVYAQREIDLYRERRGRKLAVYKTLMSTRGSKLAPDHVRALNLIDLEFAEDGKVRNLRREYFDHLGALRDVRPEEQEKLIPTWSAKSDDLLADLLGEMGRTCGYSFDKVALKREIYVPKWQMDLDTEAQLLRQLLLEILTGKRAFPMTTKLLPLDDASAAEGKSLIAALRAVLEGKQSLQVEARHSTDQAPEEAPRVV